MDHVPPKFPLSALIDCPPIAGSPLIQTPKLLTVVRLRGEFVTRLAISLSLVWMGLFASIVHAQEIWACAHEKTSEVRFDRDKDRWVSALKETVKPPSLLILQISGEDVHLTFPVRGRRKIQKLSDHSFLEPGFAGSNAIWTLLKEEFKDHRSAPDGALQVFLIGQEAYLADGGGQVIEPFVYSSIYRCLKQKESSQ